MEASEDSAVRFLKEQHQAVLADLRREIADLRQENTDLQFKLTLAAHQQPPPSAPSTHTDEVEQLREQLAVLKAKWDVMVATAHERDAEMIQMAERIGELGAQHDTDQATIKELREKLGQTELLLLPPSAYLSSTAPSQATEEGNAVAGFLTPSPPKTVRPTPPKQPSGGSGPRRSLGFRSGMYVRRSSDDPLTSGGNASAAAAAAATAAAASTTGASGSNSMSLEGGGQLAVLPDICPDVSRSYPQPAARRRLPATPQHAQAHLHEGGAMLAASPSMAHVHGVDCEHGENGEDQRDNSMLESGEFLDAATVAASLQQRADPRVSRVQSASRCSCPTRHPVVPPIGGNSK